MLEEPNPPEEVPEELLLAELLPELLLELLPEVAPELSPVLSPELSLRADPPLEEAGAPSDAMASTGGSPQPAAKPAATSPVINKHRAVRTKTVGPLLEILMGCSVFTLLAHHVPPASLQPPSSFQGLAGARDAAGMCHA